MADSPSKSWVFTWNNYPENAKELIEVWFDDSPVSRAVIGYETAPDTGTPHLQGLIVFRSAKRFSAMRKLEPVNMIHWEKCKSVTASDKYCRKGGNMCIDIDNRKKSNDKHNEFVQAIREGADDATLAEDYPGHFLRYPTALQRIRSLGRDAKRQKSDPPPVVTWIYGETGTGKTRWVVEKEDDLDILTLQGHFVLGYRHAAAVLFDDFRPRQVEFSFLLRLLDRYPLTVPIKGGHAEWNPVRIYITTTHSPEMLFAGLGENIEQLSRRLTFVLHAPDDLVRV